MQHKTKSKSKNLPPVSAFAVCELVCPEPLELRGDVFSGENKGAKESRQSCQHLRPADDIDCAIPKVECDDDDGVGMALRKEDVKAGGGGGGEDARKAQPLTLNDLLNEW